MQLFMYLLALKIAFNSYYNIFTLRISNNVDKNKNNIKIYLMNYIIFLNLDYEVINE